VLLDVTQYYSSGLTPTVPEIQNLKAVGSHFYVPNPLGGNGPPIPKFVSGSDFVIGTKNASVASVQSNFSVASVLLNNVQFGKAGGSFANFVVRTNVDGGAVPAQFQACKANDVIAIPYRANYLFFS
jgi:Protein of unknown function (DUF3455)